METVTPFQSKAEPWKAWIIEQFNNHLSKKEIHKKLLKDFPEATGVSYRSICRVLKKQKKPTKRNKRYSIRKAVELTAKEMVAKEIPTTAINVFTAVAEKGIVTSYQYVYLTLRSLNLLAKKSTEFPTNTNVTVSLDDIVNTRDFVKKLGGYEKAKAAMIAYRKFEKES